MCSAYAITHCPVRRLAAHCIIALPIEAFSISGTIAQKHEPPPTLELMMKMMTSRRNALEVAVVEAEEERLSALGEDLLWGHGSFRNCLF